LVVLGLLVGTLLCEIGLRLGGVSYPNFYQFDGDLGSSLRPGAEGWWQREGQAFVRINSAGLRDREHVLSKPDHTLRIAVLGDSYAEAVQMPMEDAFWSVLERELKDCPKLESWIPEVINFGVSGYGTAQELLMLRHRVWSYSPDIVILAFVTGNDIRNNSRVLEQEDRKPYFIFENDQLVADLSFRESFGFRLRQTNFARQMYRLMNSSRVFQVFSEAQRIVKAGNADIHAYGLGIGAVNAAENEVHEDPQATPWEGQAEAGLDATVYAEPRDRVWKDAWRVTEGVITMMRDEVGKKGAKFMLVTLSNSPQVHPDPVVRRSFAKHLAVPDLFYPDMRILELGKRQGFEVLTLAPMFQAYAQEHNAFLHGFDNSGIGIGHWNREGHRLAGKFIAEKVCSDISPSMTGQLAEDKNGSGTG
jgi:hypothetical protein